MMTMVVKSWREAKKTMLSIEQNPSRVGSMAYHSGLQVWMGSVMTPIFTHAPAVLEIIPTREERIR